MLKNGALSGVKVLDLSRMLPGPYCSMILADHGAEVIAIEKKDFYADGLSFTSLNRNKKHMTLDLKTEWGVEIFFKLAEKADVIIEGFRPGVVKRLGIDYDAVRQKNPLIIYCSISGYGQTGQRRNRPGHDVNYLSIAGVLGLIGAQNKANTIPGVQIADITGGSMNAVVGILLALYARDRIGTGQYIDISITDGILPMLSLPLHFAQAAGEELETGNSLLSHRFACYNTYETSDGRCISLGAVEYRFWKKLCDHIGRPDFASIQYNEAKREGVIGFFRSMFVSKSYDEWVKELEQLDVCCTGVKNISEVFSDVSFNERHMIVDYQSVAGSHKKAFGIPVKLSETPGTIRTQPAGFGADTKEILTTLGYTENAIKNFYKTGVV